MGIEEKLREMARVRADLPDGDDDPIVVAVRTVLDFFADELELQLQGVVGRLPKS